MDPVMNFPGGYVLDDSGNLKKWRTAKEKLRQRLMNRLVMRRGMAAIPGYEEEGSRLYTLNRVKPSQRSVKAREYVDEALQPEIEIGEISRVVDVMLNESESGKYRLVVSVELPDSEILDLEVSGTYGG
jgi:phage gp46-like protein